jgi:preprotein translocase subunit SecG
VTVLVIVLRVLWSLLAVGIVVAVLLHAAKGDGIAAIGGSAQLFSSQKSAESNLDKVTWAAVAGFLAITLVLSAGWLEQPGANTPATAIPQTAPTVPAPEPTKK